MQRLSPSCPIHFASEVSSDLLSGCTGTEGRKNSYPQHSENWSLSPPEYLESERNCENRMDPRNTINLSAPNIHAVQQETHVWNSLVSGKVLLDSGSYDVAARSFLHGIRLQPTSSRLLCTLVCYNFGSRLLSTLDSVASSVQAPSVSARHLMFNYAASLASLPFLSAKHTALGLQLLASSQLNLGNAASAAGTLNELRRTRPEIFVRTPKLQQLERQIESRRVGGRLLDRRPMVPDCVCFGSLRSVPASTQMLTCSICPARYCEETGLRNGEACPLCRVGSVVKF